MIYPLTLKGITPGMGTWFRLVEQQTCIINIQAPIIKVQAIKAA